MAVSVNFDTDFVLELLLTTLRGTVSDLSSYLRER